MTEPHPGALATTFPVAELDRRFYAFAVDRLLTWGLVAAAGTVAWLVLEDAAVVAGLVGGLVVLAWLGLAVLVGATGSSPGKSLAGLRVVHHGTGTPVGVGRALLRSLVLGLASLPTFGLGLATLAWTAVEDRGRQRRGWHDHLARSVVVDVRPVVHVVEAVDDAPRHVVNLTAMRLVPAPAVEVPAAPPRPPHPEQPARRPAPVPAPRSAPAPAPVPATAPARPPADADPGRTVVRPRRGPGVAPRWRVTFDHGESFLVEGTALVGRRPEPRAGEAVHHLVPLSSADMSVSKTHAQFGPAPDGALVVMDRGSTNGSVLVRQGVSRPLTAGKPATLLAGDVVRFGDRSMTVTREG